MQEDSLAFLQHIDLGKEESCCSCLLHIFTTWHLSSRTEHAGESAIKIRRETDKLGVGSNFKVVSFVSW